MIADDHISIKSRMEEIKAERLRAPAEHAMQTAVENYLGGDPGVIEPETNMPYLGFDIYAPVNPIMAGFQQVVPYRNLPDLRGRISAGNSKTAASCQNES